jgi:hypothetical protein
MSIFDATACAIGEAAAYLTGRVAGRTFHLEAKAARRIGEYVVIGAIFGAGLLLTVIYS